MKAEDIYQALNTRHPAPEWVYMPQVRTRTGYSRTSGSDLDSERYLDAFAINCYHGKGYRRVGYEIKVSRSDWLRELEDPRKHAQGYFLCHEFWFALAPDIYKPADQWSPIRGKTFPKSPIDGCGILEVAESGKITVLRRAVAHDAWPMPDTFVASLMRSFMTYVTRRQMLGELFEADELEAEPEAEVAPSLWSVQG